MIGNRCISFLLCVLCLLFLFAASASAEEAESFGETVPDEFSDLLGNLPPEIAELLPPELFSTDSGEVGEAVNEMSSFSFLLRNVLSAFGLQLAPCLSRFAIVLGLLLLSSVCSAIGASFSNEGIGRAFHFCSSFCILGAILAQGYTCIRSVLSYLSILQSLTTAILPLMGVLYAMGGNVTTAAASAAGLTLYITFLEHLVGKTILPFCGCCLAFACLSSLDSGVRLGRLLSTVKQQYTTVLAFLMMLLLAMLGMQTTLGARADTLAMRSAKFAAGNLIPVVGGSVSELLRTLSAGVGYLRGISGICGVLLILLSLLPTLIELLLYRMMWQWSASAADMLGCESEKKLLDEIASLCGYLIAAVSICSSVLLLSLTILAHCGSAIG